ncbi:hypothetical protein FKP32DRAFT_1193551 [Trametes sanguinea]|nr:hypothetical protein FKP32DRAFT_1193551 [Trametes sanguinea]
MPSTSRHLRLGLLRTTPSCFSAPPFTIDAVIMLHCYSLKFSCFSHYCPISIHCRTCTSTSPQNLLMPLVMSPTTSTAQLSMRRPHVLPT